MSVLNPKIGDIFQINNSGIKQSISIIDVFYSPRGFGDLIVEYNFFEISNVNNIALWSQIIPNLLLSNKDKDKIQAEYRNVMNEFNLFQRDFDEKYDNKIKSNGFQPCMGLKYLTFFESSKDEVFEMSYEIVEVENVYSSKKDEYVDFKVQGESRGIIKLNDFEKLIKENSLIPYSSDEVLKIQKAFNEYKQSNFYNENLNIILLNKELRTDLEKGFIIMLKKIIKSSII